MKTARPIVQQICAVLNEGMLAELVFIPVDLWTNKFICPVRRIAATGLAKRRKTFFKILIGRFVDFANQPTRPMAGNRVGILRGLKSWWRGFAILGVISLV